MKYKFSISRDYKGCVFFLFCFVLFCFVAGPTKGRSYIRFCISFISAEMYFMVFALAMVSHHTGRN